MSKQPYILKKSLGQHFLHDENVCKKIVDELSHNERYNLLEVGPGGGAITKYIIELEHVNYKAIEIDKEKVEYLKETYQAISDKIIETDILKADLPFDSNFRVIGNFPYNISSPILFKMLDWEGHVDEIIGMFQKEVALRVAAQPGSKVYGIPSVLMQAYFDVSYLFDVHEKSFTPPPKVKSGVLKLVNTNNPYGIENKKKFKTLIKAGFGQRRKTLRNALKPLLDAEALKDPILAKRAEQLSVGDFVELYKKYYS